MYIPVIGTCDTDVPATCLKTTPDICGDHDWRWSGNSRYATTLTIPCRTELDRTGTSTDLGLDRRTETEVGSLSGPRLQDHRAWWTMTQSRLSVALPDDVWKGDVSRRYPETNIRVTATVVGEEGGTELVWLAGAGTENCLSAIETHSDVTEMAILEQIETEATIEVVSRTTPILHAGKEAEIAVETPFDVVRGEAIVDVASTRTGLSRFGEQLRTFGLEFEVAFVHTDPEASDPLTTTQRDLLVTAVEHGYYETPRRCTLTELASTVEIAKSTCSETLQRIEEAVVDSFMTDTHSRRLPVESGPRLANETPLSTSSSGTSITECTPK